MVNLRDVYILKTTDNVFVNITKDIIRDILEKNDFDYFKMLDKEEQLKFLNYKGISFIEISEKTDKNFLYLEINKN